MKTTFYILLSLSLITTSSFAQEKKGMTRRGFLKAFGLGGGAAAAASTGILDPLSILGEGESFNIVEMLEHARKELLSEGLLDPSKRIPIAAADGKVWSYDEILRAAQKRVDLSRADKKLIKVLSREFDAIYTNPVHLKSSSSSSTKKPLNEDTKENDLESEDENYLAPLARVLEVRYTIPEELLRRMAWQLAYPEDFVLNRYSGVNNYVELLAYKRKLLRLLLPKDSEVRADPISRAYAMKWIKEVRALQNTPAVDEWVKRGRPYTTKDGWKGFTCSYLL